MEVMRTNEGPGRQMEANKGIEGRSKAYEGK